jgi:cytochrome b561
VPTQYNKSAIILHAFQGLLILFALSTGTFVLSEMPNTIEKISSFKVHIILGLFIILLTIIRIINIIKHPKLESLKVNSFREKLIRFNHISLYVVLLLVGITGILLAKGSGLGEMIIFGVNVDFYDSFKDYGVGMAHGILTKILPFLIVMHVVGVFSYKFKTKENILKRMWFNTKEK